MIKKIDIQYSTPEVSGSVGGDIYVLKKDIVSVTPFFGKMYEQGYPAALLGTYDDEEIRLIKIVNDSQFLPVFWQGNKAKEPNTYAGSFSLFNSLPLDDARFYLSISQMCKDMEHDKLDSNETTDLIVETVSDPKLDEYSKHGSGLIKLLDK
jgi:hypothetical protein